MKTKVLVAGLLLLAGLGISAFAQDEQGADPPSRVVRLNYMNGNVSMQPAGVDEWAPAVVNRPFSIGDYLYTDAKSVAELHTDLGAMRMGEYTSFGVLNLSDNLVQLKLSEGDMQFRVRRIDPNQAFEVDTPNAAINLLREGEYHIHVDAQGNTTYVAVRSGQAEITGGGQAFTLNAGSGASLSGTEQLGYNIEQVPAPDAFDQWCEQRDALEDHPAAAQYVSPSVIGYEDIQGGDWTTAPDYGPVWYPPSVPAGWAPYHNGHWAWIEPWGWTWIDDAPWGFAPFHYGRWVYWHERWGWAPGPRPVVRPVYAPALVAWFGGAHWGVSLSIGGGPALGWVPLGFGEIYTPSYHCGPNYFRNVNVSNTRIVNVTNINNVYRTVYVNKTVYNQTYVNVRAPHAIMAMPANAFASGRPVNQTARAVTPAQFANMHGAAMVAPSVAPTRMALASTLGRPAAAPPARVVQREVVARATPAARPVPFAARQAYLQEHAGQPHNFMAMHQAVAPQARRETAVRQVTQAPRPFVATPGARAGVPPMSRENRQAPAPGPQPTVAPRQQYGHGVPPNMREQQRNTAVQPRESGPAATQVPEPRREYPGARNEQRVQPRYQGPAPRNDQPVQPQPQVPAARNEQRVQRRYEAPAPRNEQRMQPQVRQEEQRREAPRSVAPQARPQERPQPAEHASAPGHQDHSSSNGDQGHDRN